jgi:type I restriction enzyme, S subunit
MKFLMAPLSQIAQPVIRPVSVMPGTSYRTIGVKWWGEGAYERETIDGSQTAANTLSIVRENDLIINKIWVRHGSTAVASKTVDGCAASGEFPTFELDQTQILPRWMQWLTKSQGFWAQCDELSRGTSGKNRIRPELFLSIHIPLPPLEEQQRIVARIEELAAKIEEARGLREEAVEEMEKMLPILFTKGYDEAFKIAGEAKRLDELCLTITDGTHVTPNYVSEGIPFLSVKDITTGAIKFDNVRFITQQEHDILTKRCKPERGDILFTKVGTTGFAKVIDVDHEFSIFVSLALLKLDKTRLDPYFTEYMLNSSFIKRLSEAGTRGVGNKNLVLKFIREFPMPAPPLPEQQRIVAYLDSLRTKLDATKYVQAQASAELDVLLPSVLDKAFKGEL